jgi:hypothetical protein
MHQDLVERLRFHGRYASEDHDGRANRINADKEAAAAEIERLRDSGASALSWLERWAVHVGNCRGGDSCTCGLVAIRHELSTSLNPQ